MRKALLVILLSFVCSSLPAQKRLLAKATYNWNYLGAFHYDSVKYAYSHYTYYSDFLYLDTVTTYSKDEAWQLESCHQQIYRYNAEHRMVSVLNRSLVGGSFINDLRSVFAYDTKGSTIAIESYFWGQSENKWIRLSSWFFIRKADENVRIELDKLLTQNGTWEMYQDSTVENESDHSRTSTRRIWTEGRWSLDKQTASYWNAAGLEERRVVKDWEKDTLERADSTIYEFNADQKEIASWLYSYNKLSKHMELAGKTISQYKAGLLESREIYKLIGSMWILMSRHLYSGKALKEYFVTDEQGYLDKKWVYELNDSGAHSSVKIYRWTPDSNYWWLQAKTDYAYDNDGDLVREEDSLWTGSSWTASKIDGGRRYYYYSDSFPQFYVPEERGFILYPNPVTDVVNVSWTLDLHPALIVVTDLTGREVIRQMPLFQGKEYNLDVYDLTPGLYFVSLYSDSEVVGTGRLIKR